MPQPWRTVRVFISSTFRDMHAERDHLVRIVFPELKERCRQRHVQLIDVDLRWGVTQEQAEGGSALDICLDEIDSMPSEQGVVVTQQDLHLSCCTVATCSCYVSPSER